MVAKLHTTSFKLDFEFRVVFDMLATGEHVWGIDTDHDLMITQA